MFHGQNKYKIKVSVHSTVQIKKLSNVRKHEITANFAFKCTFWDQNTLKPQIESWVALIEIAIEVYILGHILSWLSQNFP